MTYRQENNRYDIICCVKVSKKSQKKESNGVLYNIFDVFYAPFLLNKWVKPAVVLIFFGWLFASIAVVPKLEVGLDQVIFIWKHSKAFSRIIVHF